MRSSSFILFGLCCVSLLGCGGSTNQLPPEAEAAFREAETLEIFSLDAEPLQEGFEKHEVFSRTFPILGSVKVESQSTRDKVLAAMQSTVLHSPPEAVPACFWPRHAIRVTHDSTTHEFIICFQCTIMHWYIDGIRQDSMQIDDSARSVLDAILQEQGVPLDDPPK